MPLLYRAWVAVSALLLPFIARREVGKLRKAGLSVDRAHEKLGNASLRRPKGAPLIWFHSASVGESLSVLALITRMGVILPNAQFLMTSGTATSAALVGTRLPPRCVHQFAPLDAGGPLKRFLRHWKPDAAIFVESELWPQMLRRTHDSGAAMAMVNARLSEKSLGQWEKQPALARYLLEVFDLILTQNDAMAESMVAIGAPAARVARGVNLKSMAGPLPVDEDALYEARAALGHRPLWVASSTHKGEEEVVLAAHKALLETWPDLCLILAPRHPERGDDVAGLISAAGLDMTRRSAGDPPGAQVYLADTLGELGTWYGLSDLVFLGGSLLPIGGHNPFEVAQAGGITIAGPHVANFAETYAELHQTGAALEAGDADAIVAQMGRLLQDADARQTHRAAARAFADARTDQLDSIAHRLIKALRLADG
ncbi:3-deoxy-D-manno-octulosonic acid transferase [uncultured Sulfitobacter sp.]|uniref:3-deoxy-D-manno-octulosonic acid transferase n=1 Tax=uncultured Sulfitobacter sp. TaxID=191468 RepID=UPI002638F825|nr:3-deoxy-D-manno-octulosonic acid transferase [uncultured Sulfitobacter sp.]